MAENLSLFGSNGSRDEARVFGRRNSVAASAPLEPARPFGKRTQFPAQRISLQRARLSQIRAELLCLFEDPAFPGDTPDFVLVDGPTAPRLLIGNRAWVRIDDDTGQLVFIEISDEVETIVTTTNDDRLLDHIMSHLAGQAPANTPFKASTMARNLVGQTLQDVERHLILQTLRHCHGNRTHTARVLGVSLRTVRNKLRNYWLDREGCDEVK